MSTIHRDADGSLLVMVKGAPRELLARCTGMDDACRGVIVSAIDGMAAHGLRVLGLAQRRIGAHENHLRLDSCAPGDVETGLTFLGLVGMEDPPREEVADAITACRGAGITIIMITGDDGLTAEVIARQIGLVGERPTVVSGTMLDAMKDEELDAVLAAQELIFSRATPEDKLLIVTRLQARGEIVAVTGDGVNDAPALKKADIGAAMGRSGTDVARAAADMVLLDDNFATIVAAVEEGRAIFDNMRKFIVYIFAHLSPEAIPFILFALLHTPLPLTVMQILAIDLGTETLPALALGMERPEADVMRRRPRSRGERLLNLGTLIRGYGFLGMMTTLVVVSGFLAVTMGAGWRPGVASSLPATIAAEASTVTFVGIVVMQIANAFACRTERQSAFGVGFASNRLLLAGIVFEVLLTVAIVYTPIGQVMFGTAGVPVWWWLVCAAAIVPAFLAEEARKWLVRRRTALR
jgi:magnesium-transporting ATPase (P-type)